MKNRSLVALIAVLLMGEFATPAFADEVKDPVKASAKHKRPRKQIASCGGLYSYGTYLVGRFHREDSTESLMRDGLGLGTNCSYNNRSRFTFGIMVEFDGGEFHFNHQEDSVKGIVSAYEMGFKTGISLSADLHRMKISLMAAVQQTVSQHSHINSLKIRQGDGWLDETDLANEFLSIDGYMQVWDIGLDVEFPLSYGFSITSGGLFQRYNMDISTKLEDDGRRILRALHYDVSKVERTFKNSANFFSLHPGVRWCRERMCTSFDLMWGVFKEEKWSWGFTLAEGIRF